MTNQPAVVGIGVDYYIRLEKMEKEAKDFVENLIKKSKHQWTKPQN